MKNNFFTIIIPTHKRSILLERALRSIREQNVDDILEVIVIADVHDQKTSQVCSQYLTENDIYLVRNGECGPAASRNMGIILSKGKNIIFLDDDDALHPGYLSSINNINNFDFAYCDCSVVKERRLSEGPEFISEQNINLNNSLNSNVFVKNQVHMSCYIFPSYLLKNVEFDACMRAYEDWDFLLSIFDKKMPYHIPVLGSRIYEVPDETTDRRGSSESALNFNAVLDYLYVYRRHPVTDPELRKKRSALLTSVGMRIDEIFL